MNPNVFYGNELPVTFILLINTETGKGTALSLALPNIWQKSCN